MGHYYSEMYSEASAQELMDLEKARHKAVKATIREILKESILDEYEYLEMLVEIWNERKDWIGVFNLLNRNV